MKKHSHFSLAAIILAICVLLCSCAGASKFPEHIEAGEYSEAINDYSSYILGNIDKELEAESFLEDYLAEKRTKFSTGEISPEEMKSALECVQKVDDEFGIVTSALTTTREAFDSITTSRENYEAGVSALESGDYKAAIDAFENVYETDQVNYDTAKEQLDTARTSYKVELLGAVQDAIDEEDYEKAISLGEDGKAALGNDDSDMQNLIDHAAYLKAEKLIDGYISEENYEMVIRTYDDFAAKNQALVTAELTEKVEKCKAEYIDSVIQKSKDAYFSDGAEAAIAEIQTVQTITNSDKLTRLLELFESALPVYTEDIKHDYSSHSATHFTTASDYYGNVYEGKLIKIWTFWMDDSTKLEIIPNGGFNNFSFELFPDESFSKYDTANIEVYGDGRLLQAEKGYVYTSESKHFSMDISGVRVVEIVLTDKHGDSVLWMKDAILENKLTENDIQLAIQ